VRDWTRIAPSARLWSTCRGSRPIVGYGIQWNSARVGGERGVAPGVRLYVPRQCSDRSASMVPPAGQLALKGHGDLRVVVRVALGLKLWGTTSTPRRSGFAHRLIDAGIDVVHGHSSHQSPADEGVYRGRLILLRGLRGHESTTRRHLYVRGHSGNETAGCCTSRPIDSQSGKRLAPWCRCGCGGCGSNSAPRSDAEWLRATMAEMSRRFGTRVESAPDGVLDGQRGLAISRTRRRGPRSAQPPTMNASYLLEATAQPVPGCTARRSRKEVLRFDLAHRRLLFRALLHEPGSGETRADTPRALK